MHGEYKVPGGKLVVVDLEVEDGLIRDFRLAGDFFLEPDTALEAINAAVEGMHESLGKFPEPAAQQRMERRLPTLRAALGGDAFAAEWATGRALQPDEAVAEALALGKQWTRAAGIS